MQKARPILSARALSSFLFVAALGSGQVPAFSEPLRIAYTATALVYGPLWISQEAGIFKKYGIDADKLLYIAGGTPSTQALIAGEVDIAFTAAGAVVAANLSGSDVVLLGATIDILPFEIWAAPTIKGPSQLKGTRMGVSRLGATSDFVGRYVLKKWGLKPGADVIIFQTGGIPEVFAALKGGSIQSGVIDTGPFTVQAQIDGFVRLVDVATLGLPYVFGPFAARQSFLKKQPDLVTRFMKAYVEGIYRFKTEKRLALEAIEKYTKVKITPVTEQIYETYATRYVKRVPEATPEGIQTILDEIAENRPIPAGVKPERFVESRFVKEVVQSGFVDALYKGR
jgi:NitT/TauT family transport system substrate-binding protein